MKSNKCLLWTTGLDHSCFLRTQEKILYNTKIDEYHKLFSNRLFMPHDYICLYRSGSCMVSPMRSEGFS